MHVTHTPEIVIRRAARRLDTAAWGFAAFVTVVLTLYSDAIGLEHEFLLLAVMCILTKWLAKRWIMADALTSFSKARDNGFVIVDDTHPPTFIRIMVGCKRPWLVTLYAELVELPRIYKVDKK